MKRRTILAGALAGLSTQARPQTSPTAWRAQVEEAERAFAASMAKRDMAAFTLFLSDEAVFFNQGQPLRGKHAVVDGWKKFFEGPGAPFSWEPTVVEVLDSGTLAFTSGPVRNPGGEVVGRFNSIWRLEGGRWRVVFDRGSPVCKA